MKKLIYLSIFTFVLIAFQGFSQISNFTVSPSAQCFNSNGTTGSAGMSSHVPSATTYSWVIMSPTGSCSATFSTASTATGVPSNSLININYSCCGIYTIACFAYNTNVSPAVLIATIIQTANITCSSNLISVSGNTSICSGAPSVLYASGASNYTWQPGNLTGDSIVVTPSVSTCYTVTGTSSTTCINPKVICVNVQSSGSVSISGPSGICAGSYATLYASGSTNYTWLPGGSNATSIVVSPTASTCYTLFGYTCAGLTSSVKCLTVSTAPVISVSGNTSVCSGQSTTISLSGASTYTWYPGSSTGSSIVISPTATSCYSVIGSNGYGCNGYAGICVYVNNSSTINVSGPSSICNGSSATLTASGLSTYTWQPGGLSGSSIVVSPTASICYTVSGSSGTGCSASAVKCLSVQSSGSVSISGTNYMCSGTYNYLQANGGTSYTWYPGGSTSNSITITPSVSTCYSVIGQTCGGVSSNYHCVTVNPSPSLSFSGTSNVCAGSSASLSVSGATSYTWMAGGNTYTGSSIVFTPTATSCFSVYGTTSYSNGGNCASYGGTCVTVQGGSLYISGPTAICAGNSATWAVSGSQSYTWYPGGITGSIIALSPSVTTCYTVYGSSGTGCGGSAVRCLVVNSNPSITTNNGSGQFCSGTAVLSASGASSYTWYPFNFTGSAITITVGSSMCYTVVGTNSVGCAGSAVNCFSVSPSPTITVSGSNVNCSGQSTTLTVSGAQSYIWYPGASSGSSIVISPSVSTCYTVAGTTNGCTSYAVKCVSIQTGPSITSAGGNTVCAGNTSTVFANGAVTYTWLPGNMTGAVIAITPSVSTCYTIVGTASNGCVGLGSLCMQVLPKPTITTSGGVYCAGSTTTLSASGANSYVWQPGNLSGSSIVITSSITTCYTITGSNSNGCSNQAVSCLSVIASPILNVSGANLICSGQSASLSVSGASNYTWLPGNTNGSNIVISPSVSTCYTVKGYNSVNGCISQAIKCVSVQPSPVINVSGNNVLCSGSSANLLASGANTYTWNTGSNSPIITVSPSLNTCYTVYGSNTQGCIGSAVKCVTVQSAPLITINGPSAICFGSNATFIASGASSYSWNTGSNSNVIVVSPVTNTVYSVSGSNGVCSSVKSISVAVNPLPSIYVYTSDSTLCAGNSATLTAMGANSYTWNNGSVSSSIVVSPNVTSFYSVSGTGSNGCSNSVLMTVHVSACTGISEQIELSGVLLYPNPIKDQLHLQYSNSSLVTYKIYDLLGRELLIGEFSHEKEIDLSAFCNGSYVIQLEVGSMSTYKKLIIEK